MKRSSLVMILLMLMVMSCSSLMPQPTASTVTPHVVDTASRLKELGGYPCPDSDFTCVKLSVPLNHFASQDKRTIDVVFAVLPATGNRKGMLVTATGGPGTAGLLSADSYTSAFDSSIPEGFDIVFFDQRGVGQSGGLQCAQAAATYYRSDNDMSTVEGETAFVNASHTFANDCVKELGNSEILPYLGTEQAVEDLEFFRNLLGDEKFWLYGESYGTQYAQTYAAAHPEHLAGLIIDGAVDLTLSSTDYLNQQAHAFSDVLLLSLKACNEDEVCAESMGGGDAIKAYDLLAKQLKDSPITLNFPLPSGKTAERAFSFTDLESVASSALYSQGERMMFLRSLAAYSRSADIVPMARQLYYALGLDPETLTAIADPSYSDAEYYAVECQDYSYFNGTPEEKATAYLRTGDVLDSSMPYFSSIYYGDMPCVFWPHARENTARPVALKADGIPTLVLGAQADPATPISNGRNIFNHLSNGYLVVQEGGPHIIFGRGVECIDQLVTEFLVNDKLPAQRETSCNGNVIDDFVPLAPLDASQFTSPLEALSSAENEIYYLPEYYEWDVVTPTSAGCPFGGVLSFQTSDTGASFSLNHCSFTKGFILTGSGSYDFDTQIFTLQANISGLKEGVLTYSHNGDDTFQVTGTYDGKAIDLSQ